ncbi:LysR family transcriptional regulator [Streptomyces fungicidicus]|jgi:DNA-binding transcriptional LysR family regulator|uniref:LysR family transcriptional regulator n=2 Tax=Streptomyces TaxID=1883 RepID=A0A494UMP5_9ACTN|nr:MULTISPECIES: LysR family transcriptional regulator [Streptomyces]AYL35810.1 LysR family transcriptional regulator [Streptomyces fungicidicus]EFL41623.1 LysR family transcriptional regulator [Streptomyces griseoflavus Tu4000]QBA57729.1 LysR family transcriptional regulator [Streptomyces sp. SNM55]TQL22799.1 regulatory helix-turn-helix LysR family protein [Streptomyces sp. SLBN-134]
MHEREFRAFVLIAETGRMDVAARKLGYSQPAITYQVKRLEESLGYKLFTRHPTGARLTGDGRMILPSVRAVLLLIDSMRDAQGSRSDEDRDLERSA